MKSVAHAALLLMLASIAFGESLELTVARLSGSSWGNHRDVSSPEGVRRLGGLFIRFSADMSFSAVLGPGQGGERAIAGRYAVDDNKLSLSIVTQAGLVPWLTSGVLRYDSQLYGYPFYYIEFPDAFSSAGQSVFAPQPANDHVLLDLTTTLSPGRSIVLGGVAAVVVNAHGKTTDVLNTRVAPTVLAERVAFATATGASSSIPKGAGIRVLARTAAVDRVGSLESYWLYIEYWPDPAGSVNAWVFGRYVEME